jgi:predicted DNA-binding transcriptional regulator YafY
MLVVRLPGPDRGSLQRAIEIHYRYYSMPVWYALAWDRLRGGVRSFRIDRITTATAAAEQFKLERPDEFLAAVEATTRHL